MFGYLRSKIDKHTAQAVDRYLDFKPFILDLDIEGAPVRFLVATAQSASWYSPLNSRNKMELEWLIANLDLESAKIIDAGAYHGLYTSAFAKAAGPNGLVIAVDPVGSNCAVIEANLALNGLPCRIENCAISNSEGAVSFSKGSCGHILASGDNRVPARRFRDIAPDAEIVKCDIEGEEFSVIPEQIDEMTSVRAWVLEIHPGANRDTQALVETFASRGHRLLWSGSTDGQIVPYEGEPVLERITLVALRDS